MDVDLLGDLGLAGLIVTGGGRLRRSRLRALVAVVMRDPSTSSQPRDGSHMRMKLPPTFTMVMPPHSWNSTNSTPSSSRKSVRVGNS